MINILHTIDTTGPGGAETVFIELLSRLDKSKYKATVVIRGRGWVHDELCRRGFSPYIVNAKGSFNLKYLFSLIKIIRRERIDVVQSHLLGSNVYCCLAGWLTKTPVIATFHGVVDLENERMINLKIRIVNHLARNIVPVSEQLKNLLLDYKFVTLNKLKVIYNGVYTNNFQSKKSNVIRKELDFSESDIIIGSIGNIRAPKGYEDLIQAAYIVAKKKPKIKFVVVGENKNTLYEALLKRRDDLGLENNVYFLGFRSNVAEILNSIDLYLLSSTSEGCSISTIEAMASGVPIIVTKCGGLEEMVSDQHDALIVGIRAPAEIAEAILKLTEDNSLRTKITNNALKTVNSRFTLDAMLDAYKALYSVALD